VHVVLLPIAEEQEPGRSDRLHRWTLDASSPSEDSMAIEQFHVPHDHRTTVTAMGAIVVLAAIIIFLMITLMRNVGAY
jgi:hypothetical protein